MKSENPPMPLWCALNGRGVSTAEYCKAYFSPRHVCDALGISWPRQFRKIKEDEFLKSTVVISPTVAADGKKRVQTMLPIEFANGWLFTIKIWNDPVLSLKSSRKS
jgi:hypothetical protein